MALAPNNYSNGTGDATRVNNGIRSLSSSGSEDTQTVYVQSSSSHLYHIYHTTFRHDYLVSDADKKHLYYVDNSHLTSKKPDLTLHAGEDTNAPVAGVCKFLHFSRHFKLGLGDPQKIRSMTWEDLICQNLTMTKYRWQMSVPTPDGRLGRQTFMWKRTHSVAVDGESPSVFSLHNYKLVDEQTGRIVAVFTSNSFKSFRKSGKLQVEAAYGQDFDLMALVTLLAIYEKQRRCNGGKGGGGGGGDGG